MITTTLGNLIKSSNSLNLLCNEKIPVLASFYLAKIVNKSEEYFKPYNAAKLALQKKYLSDGETVTMPENLELAEKEHQELLTEEVKFDCERLPIERLGDIKIETGVMIPLIWIFKEQ